MAQETANEELASKVLGEAREEEALPLESTSQLAHPLKADPQLEAEKAVEASIDASDDPWDLAVSSECLGADQEEEEWEE